MEYQTNAEQDNEDELITFYIQYFAKKQKQKSFWHKCEATTF